MIRARGSRRGTDPDFLRRTTGRSRGSMRARGHNTWWVCTFPQSAGRSIAYFSANRPASVAPIYAGGLGVLRAITARKRRLGVPPSASGHVSARLLPSDRVAEGWQQESYERLNGPDTASAALTPDGNPAERGPAGDRTVLARLWVCESGGWSCTCSTPISRENAPWDRELSARCTRRPRDPRAAGNILGRRRARAQSPGFDPDVFTSTRTRGVRRPAAHPELTERDRASTTPRGIGEPGLHDAHNGRGDKRIQSISSRRTGRLLGNSRAKRDRFLALGSYDNGAGPQST